MEANDITMPIVASVSSYLLVSAKNSTLNISIIPLEKLKN
jgi:hypothetical protein